MMHVKEVLLDQLLANANDTSWYISFQESVEGVTEETAFWKPDDSSHSIAEIVQHLIYWNEVWQKRYKKNHVNAVSRIENNDDSFILPKDTPFSALKDQLLKILLDWQDLITEEQLESEVNGFPEKTDWWGIISNAATHNAYHIGQIAYVRKLVKN
ncbi:DinB family protein [Cytobacillus purgationiresistens]|uniref:Damage-inducible protein DinB n=1 Tax=Cytobacillus purgationiresistens TaxID=863449 RepID=A0ABU0AM03_9BACI|nr:DinB family protein [Cytobacillus purgationiresistens]MDQ0272293.1 putative damage-inducible protein DinB [Cytobacillus purgationiresistens]